MTTRCKAGDLAVVVSAHNSENLGQIVSVIEAYDGRGPLVFGEECGFVWLCESPLIMAWQVNDRYFRARRGPVPDSSLKPLRGQTDETGRSSEECPADGLSESRDPVPMDG